jgi:hypothetical protein
VCSIHKPRKFKTEHEQKQSELRPRPTRKERRCGARETTSSVRKKEGSKNHSKRRGVRREKGMGTKEALRPEEVLRPCHPIRFLSPTLN